MEFVLGLAYRFDRLRHFDEIHLSHMLIMVCTELLNQRGLAHLPGTRDQ